MSVICVSHTARVLVGREGQSQDKCPLTIPYCKISHLNCYAPLHHIGNFQSLRLSPKDSSRVCHHKPKNSCRAKVFICLQCLETYRQWAKISKLSVTDGLKRPLNYFNNLSTLWTRQTYLENKSY